MHTALQPDSRHFTSRCQMSPATSQRGTTIALVPHYTLNTSNDGHLTPYLTAWVLDPVPQYTLNTSNDEHLTPYLTAWVLDPVPQYTLNTSTSVHFEHFYRRVLDPVPHYMGT